MSNSNNIKIEVDELLRKGKIIITRNGLLSQDFETADGKIKVFSKRIGGGFTAGTTIHYLVKEGVTRQAGLDEIFSDIVDYFKSLDKE